jgi:hypothetical protein
MHLDKKKIHDHKKDYEVGRSYQYEAYYDIKTGMYSYIPKLEIP